MDARKIERRRSMRSQKGKRGGEDEGGGDERERSKDGRRKKLNRQKKKKNKKSTKPKSPEIIPIPASTDEEDMEILRHGTGQAATGGKTSKHLEQIKRTYEEAFGWDTDVEEEKEEGEASQKKAKKLETAEDETGQEHQQDKEH